MVMVERRSAVASSVCEGIVMCGCKRSVSCCDIQPAVVPPSTVMLVPVTQFASSAMECRRRAPRFTNKCSPWSSNHSAADLIELNGFEQRLEIALAEALVAFALNNLEKDRTKNIGREYLQQYAVLDRAIDQNAALL
jgi:hypothetical protein